MMKTTIKTSTVSYYYIDIPVNVIHIVFRYYIYVPVNVIHIVFRQFYGRKFPEECSRRVLSQEISH